MAKTENTFKKEMLLVKGTTQREQPQWREGVLEVPLSEKLGEEPAAPGDQRRKTRG